MYMRRVPSATGARLGATDDDAKPFIASNTQQARAPTEGKSTLKDCKGG